MGVTTEISRPDLHSDTARVLRTQLVRLREREQDGQQYSDIMLYPGSQHLLYRGDFLGAKFDGEGSLYYRQGNQVWTPAPTHAQLQCVSTDPPLCVSALSCSRCARQPTWCAHMPWSEEAVEGLAEAVLVGAGGVPGGVEGREDGGVGAAAGAGADLYRPRHPLPHVQY
eukprot:1666484-Rhodomonas_salina.2